MIYRELYGILKDDFDYDFYSGFDDDFDGLSYTAISGFIGIGYKV